LSVVERIRPSSGLAVVLGLGSNIEPETHLVCAVEFLQRLLTVEAISSAWVTPAVGTVAPDFLNAVVLVRTRYNQRQIKGRIIHWIENRLGRVRNADKNAPRTIDIDILMIGNEILEPRIWTQGYLAVPLAQIMPDLCAPTSGESLIDIANRLQSQTPLKERADLLAHLAPRRPVFKASSQSRG
jgi:2-amino-4-hydroxy-6-hydroxymethyldihydropteridine diphosphokinase